MPELIKATRIVRGSWETAHLCVKCHKRMSDRDRLYSYGVCPSCGYADPGTVCKTTKRVFRTIKHQRRVFGLFWVTERREVERVDD